MNKKYFCVYLPYHKSDIVPSSDEEFKNLPSFPKQFARVRVYTSKIEQLDCYANTPCLESLTFEANSKEEIEQKVEELKNNFENEDWLRENIYCD